MELVPFLATFFCCLFINMEYGILIGAQIHLLLLAYEATRSKSDCVPQKVFGLDIFESLRYQSIGYLPTGYGGISSDC